MSVDKFIENISSQLLDLRAKRSSQTLKPTEKGALTRAIKECEAALSKASRRGIK